MKRFISTEDLQDLPHCNYKDSLKDAESLGRVIAPTGDGNTVILLGAIALIEELREDARDLRDEIGELQSINRYSKEGSQL